MLMDSHLNQQHAVLQQQQEVIKTLIFVPNFFINSLEIENQN